MESVAEGIESFGSSLLSDAQLNPDGTLKQNGKQNVKFYNKTRLAFRAKKDENGKPIIDPKTGIPFKEAYEEKVEMVRVETKGDTTIKDDIADEFSKRQFVRQYRFFRDGKIPDGNPIEDFDFIQPNSITELRMHGIYTLQQLAVADDIVCERLQDQSGFELRDVAAQWVKINSPQGQLGKVSVLEAKVKELERKLASENGGKEPVQRIVQPVIVPDEPIETIELTPEVLKKGRKVTRKV